MGLWPLFMGGCQSSVVSCQFKYQQVSNLNILRSRGRFRQRVAAFPHGGDVKIRGFTDKLKGLFSRFPYNRASWQIRYICAKTVFALFENYDVPHHVRLRSQGGTFAAALQGASNRVAIDG